MGRGYLGGKGGRGGYRGGFNKSYEEGPPERIEVLGEVMHYCQNDLVCKNVNQKVPYFNAPVYLENKEEIGKIDEVFGPKDDSYFSVHLKENLKPQSFKKSLKLYISDMKLLSIERIMNNCTPRGRGAANAAGRGKPAGDRGRGRGNFGRNSFNRSGNGGRGGRGSFNRGGSNRGGGNFNNRGQFRGNRGFNGPRRG